MLKLRRMMVSLSYLSSLNLQQNQRELIEHSLHKSIPFLEQIHSTPPLVRPWTSVPASAITVLYLCKSIRTQMQFTMSPQGKRLQRQAKPTGKIQKWHKCKTQTPVISRILPAGSFFQSYRIGMDRMCHVEFDLRLLGSRYSMPYTHWDMRTRQLVL